MKIECPKDIGFENTFPDNECEMKKFYGDCYHCWQTSITKHNEQERLKGAQEFADFLVKENVLGNRVIYNGDITDYGKVYLDKWQNNITSDIKSKDYTEIIKDLYSKHITLSSKEFDNYLAKLWFELD